MSNEMAPGIVALSPTGPVTYILDASNTSLTQVQLAVPVTEFVVIGEDIKSVSLSENPVLVADIAPESLNWLGNNVIVLVNQPQDVVVVDSSSVPDGSVAQQWYGDSATASTALESLSQFVTNLLSQDNGDEPLPVEICEEDLTVETQDENDNAQRWVQDSIISVAALNSLESYAQSHETSKSE